LILPDSLNQFLDLSQRRHSYSMVQIMSYEMMRLHSFKREFTASVIRVDFLLPVLWMKLNVLAVVHITEIGNLRIFHIYCTNVCRHTVG
jgi:hypothetical protein